jgi:hypothetical protein
MSTQTNRIFVKGLAILGVLALTAIAGCAGSEEQTEEGAGAIAGEPGGQDPIDRTKCPKRECRADGLPRDPARVLGERFRAAELARERGEATPELSEYPVGRESGWGDIWSDWVRFDPAFETQRGFQLGNVKVLTIDRVRENAPPSRETRRESVRFYRADDSGVRLGSCVRDAQRNLVNCQDIGADPEAAAP